MLIGHNFIYLELLKTASSHTRKILESIPQLQVTPHGKHTTLRDVPAEINWREKMIIGNVRNPWDWYVSHWAFGCMRRGGMYKRLNNHRLNHFFRSPLLVLSEYKRFAINRNIIKKCFSDSLNQDNFKKWLNFVLHHPTQDVEHGYFKSKSYNNMGLYTYEYFKMYSDPDAFPALIKNPADFVSFNNHIVLDQIISSEDLNEQLLALAPQLGLGTGSMKMYLDQLSEKTNPSVRKTYKDYYDEESRSWVLKQDQFIINRHGYTF